MSSELTILFLLVLGTVAFLYSSVGHGGASGYLATMALFSVEPSLMKSTALILNIFVSLMAFYQYYRGGHFKWKLFYPFALASIPFSFIGATIPITDTIYKKVLAACILISLIRLLFQPKDKPGENTPIPLIGGLMVGAGIGLLSGMLGIGGGIILSPVMLLMNWGKMKETATVSALFIFVNSISGLIGMFSKGFTPNPETFSWLIVAFIGGIIGSYLGSKKFNVPTLRYLLAISLSIACLKLIFT